MKRVQQIILASLALVGVVACANLIPRKGWGPNQGPVVPHDSFPADCALCHESGSWNKIKADFTFDHEKETGVLLQGAHNDAQCLLCHNDRGPVKQFADRGCQGCHEDVHVGRLGMLCAQCHNEETWSPLQKIAEHARTRFPLIGGHAAVDCNACHPQALEGNYETRGIECESCHADDATRATNPDHIGMNLTTNCERCHNPVAWDPALFEHPASFPLTLGHGGSGCIDCHTTPGVFTGLSTDCASCHLDSYQATTNPNHAAAGFATTCATCHTTVQWSGGSFIHSSTFPLAQAHAVPACVDCHTTPGVFAGLSTACVSCHLPEYQATASPNHTAAGFSTDCALCHAPTQWPGAGFSHPGSFPLAQAHAVPACSDCHTTPGTFTGLSTACVSCHLPDYQATTNPNHTAAGFSTDCVQCHATTIWAGAGFTHPATFPLAQAHAVPACTDCHTVPGTFTGLSTECVSCHLPEYQATTNPNHTGAGFPTACAQCHPITLWINGNFTHPSSFPLTQAHAVPPCSACHTTPGVFTGLSTACINCHQDDYQRGHNSSGVSQNCRNCHNTSGW